MQSQRQVCSWPGEPADWKGSLLISTSFLSPFSKHFCKTLLFLPSYSPFSCQASSSATFSCGSSLLRGHFHLPPSLPACLVLIPSGRWRRGEEEHEGTCEDFQATTLGCLPAHKRCSLCPSAKSNVMQWGTTGQVRIMWMYCKNAWRTTAFSCSVMCSVVKSFSTRKVQEQHKCECLLLHCPQSVSKPLQGCCHATKASTRHGHIPQARLPHTISSMWIWGLSRGYFNVTLVSAPTKQTILELQGVVGMWVVTHKALSAAKSLSQGGLSATANRSGALEE